MTRTLLVVIVAALGFLTDAATAQKTNTSKITKQIEKVQKKISSLDKRIATENKRVSSARKRLLKDHKLVLDAVFHETMGEAIASAVTQHANSGATNGHRAEGAFKDVSPLFKKKLGRIMSDVTREHLRDLITILMEDHSKITPKRCARDLRDFMKDAVPTDFDKAWEKKLKQHCCKSLESMQRDRRALTEELEALRAALAGNIKGQIPQNMVIVPASEGDHGWDGSEIQSLGKADDTNLAQNKYLFLGSAQNRCDVPAFLMDRTEVTHRAYWYFCTQTGRAHPLDKAKNPLWPDEKVAPGWENRPVTYVSLDDAMEYAAWIGARLPTEYEWEAAARSGKNGYDGRYWAWGNTYEEHLCNDSKAHSVLERRRMYSITPKGVDLPGVLPVGHFEKGCTPLGIHDMNGNAAEWTTSPFMAHKTFGKQKFKKFGISMSDFSFDSEKVTVKGGHCDQRNLIVASAMRLGVHPIRGKKNLGFRCARSATPGLDRFNQLTKNHRLDSRLADFGLMRCDVRADRDFPALDSRPSRYAILEKLEFNEELQVRGKAHSIFIASRNQNELTSPKTLQDVASGDEDIPDAFLVGYLNTDVEIVDPPLPAGAYFVAYKAGGVKVDEETKKKTKIADAFLFVPKKSGEEPIRVERFRPSAIVVSKSKSPTLLEKSNDKRGDVLTAVFSYDIKVRSKGSFQIILDLVCKKGALADFD